MIEIWKDIEGYEGIYEVSNLGRIKALEKLIWNGYGYFIKKEQIRKISCNNKTGYCHIPLWVNNKPKMYYIHRLVASAFINNVENKKEVNHKDGDKKNNNVNNLEWVDRIQNIRHSIKILGNRQDGSFNNNTKLTELDVYNIKNDNRIHRLIAADYNVSRTAITMIKNNKNWKTI